jgi:hypothetical protein
LHGHPQNWRGAIPASEPSRKKQAPKSARKKETAVNLSNPAVSLLPLFFAFEIRAV